jgi:hypothetical protein
LTALPFTTDGVAPGNNQLPKQQRIEKGLADVCSPLQNCVSEILTQIAELGETDDLTLVAFRLVTRRTWR